MVRLRVDSDPHNGAKLARYGWGVMLDDLAAAVYAAALVWVVSWLVWMR